MLRPGTKRDNGSSALDSHETAAAKRTRVDSPDVVDLCSPSPSRPPSPAEADCPPTSRPPSPTGVDCPPTSPPPRPTYSALDVFGPSSSDESSQSSRSSSPSSSVSSVKSSRSYSPLENTKASYSPMTPASSRSGSPDAYVLPVLRPAAVPMTHPETFELEVLKDLRKILHKWSTYSGPGTADFFRKMQKLNTGIDVAMHMLISINEMIAHPSKEAIDVADEIFLVCLYKIV